MLPAAWIAGGGFGVWGSVDRFFGFEGLFFFSKKLLELLGGGGSYRTLRPPRRHRVAGAGALPF